MICFQIEFFHRVLTGQLHEITLHLPLWFAFRLSSFTECLQEGWFVNYHVSGCDLLSDWVLSQSAYRTAVILWFYNLVVICFQIEFFHRVLTGTPKRPFFRISCDLLSDWVLSQSAYRQMFCRFRALLVVICFQIEFFHRVLTGCASIQRWWCKLWFAFRLSSFTECLQGWWFHRWYCKSCDLLSDWVLSQSAYRIRLSHSGCS